ncbi:MULTISPECIES: TetR/AcrR family transcriptional regulator [unclassified Pseudomonas]|uniref:TetR/AcrR family transcriptional regulator n=1 Tax=unclassified Pseudomonas TaxID=196821 RepID=UPI000481981B|nr:MULTISPECIES: TetR family transcriptional regulator [unclassified Pseudomonas]SMF65629.1 transcriptional regulator, TetR family [Pseudomonas sp. LAMO17WK12:I1]
MQIKNTEKLSTKGELKRGALIDAALRVILREGHHNLSLRTVAKEAGSSHGAVAYYFGSRTALMCAAIDQACARIAESLREIRPQLEDSASDPLSFATIIAQYNIRMLIDDRELGIAVYELNLAGAHNPDLRPSLYKWGKIHSDICHEAFLRLGSKNPAEDYAFLLHTIGGLIVAQLSLPRHEFESKVFLPAIKRLVLSISDHP